MAKKYWLVKRRTLWKTNGLDNRLQPLQFCVFSSHMVMVETSGRTSVQLRDPTRAVASLSHPGGQDGGKMRTFLNLSLFACSLSNFSSNVLHFLPHFGLQLGRQLAQPWLRHWTQLKLEYPLPDIQQGLMVLRMILIFLPWFLQTPNKPPSYTCWQNDSLISESRVAWTTYNACSMQAGTRVWVKNKNKNNVSIQHHKHVKGPFTNTCTGDILKKADIFRV